MYRKGGQMFRQLTRLTVALLFALLLAIAAGCGGSSPSPSPSATGASVSASTQPNPGTTIRMGIEPWIGYGPWYIAQEKGYFKENGIDVEIINFATDAQREAAYVGEKTDVSNMPTHTSLLFVQQGVDAKGILLEDVSMSADAVLARSPITSIAQLKGKKVAYEQGTTSDILIHYALAANGMSESDIVPVPMAASDAGSALIAGRVDAAVTYEPYISAALHEGAKSIYAASEDPGLVSDVLVAHTSLATDNPGALVALCKSWGQAVDYYNSNTADAQAIIAKGVGASVSDLETAFKGVKLFDLDQNVQMLTGDFATKIVPDVMNAAVASGFLTQPVDATAFIDPTFVEAAAGR